MKKLSTVLYTILFIGNISSANHLFANTENSKGSEKEKSSCANAEYYCAYSQDGGTTNLNSTTKVTIGCCQKGFTCEPCSTAGVFPPLPSACNGASITYQGKQVSANILNPVHHGCVH